MENDTKNKLVQLCKQWFLLKRFYKNNPGYWQEYILVNKAINQYKKFYKESWKQAKYEFYKLDEKR